jgi:hypothetical protein
MEIYRQMVDPVARLELAGDRFRPIPDLHL